MNRLKLKDMKHILKKYIPFETWVTLNASHAVLCYRSVGVAFQEWRLFNCSSKGSIAAVSMLSDL